MTKKKAAAQKHSVPGEQSDHSVHSEYSAHEVRILLTGGQGADYVEKKSRFFATLSPVTTEAKALDFVSRIRRKYYDARHNCYAYILGQEQEISKCSDDGEPSGTAGRPMLEVLRSAGVTDAVAVVTRYFGGTLLGSGGLVRAYTAATQAGLAACRLALRREGERIDLTIPYAQIDPVLSYLRSHDILLEESAYLSDVRLRLILPAQEADAHLAAIQNLTQARAQVTRLGACTYTREWNYTG